MNKKNVIITIISVLILTCLFAFARTTTTDLGLVKPTWSEDIDILDDLNANSDLLEAFANDPLEFDSDLERLEDRAGAMWTGNTETGITMTYQDADNTIDAVIGADDIVESMLKAVNAPLDEEIFTYESTTGDFEWHTLAELSIQPLDAGLTSIAGLTTAANKMIYTTALDTYAVIDLTAFARTIIDDADASAVRTTLGLVIGTNVQAYDAGLLSLAGLTYASDSFIKVTATDVYAIRTITETKTDLSLDNVTNDAQIAKSLGTTQGDIIYFTGSATPVRLAKGVATEVLTMNAGATAPEWAASGAGYTNLTSFVDQTAWRVFHSNTDGDVVELALGADGTYLKSNGAAAAPTFATPAGSGTVTTSGTPVDDDFAKFTTATAIEGRSYSETMMDLNPVTSKSGVATLTIAEAGTVLVSAAAGYTLTLPTASGHSGLRYHFIKTDANYNLITLDGNGAETFNYENSTSAPATTYTRLNSYCAEVTIVSDGTNWQVINEVLGQNPYCWAYLGAIDANGQDDVLEGTFAHVALDQEEADIGSNFDVSDWVSSSATSTSAGHLVDSTAPFTSAMVGRRVRNTTDSTTTYITVYNSTTDVTVRDDIFINAETYVIKHSKYVTPVTGRYLICFAVSWYDGVVDKRYIGTIYVNGSEVLRNTQWTGGVSYFACNNTFTYDLTKDDYVELYYFKDDDQNTTDVWGVGKQQTYLQLTLLSK